jgi:hypothetical protein
MRAEGHRGRQAYQARSDHSAGRGRGTASGPGAAGLHCHGSEPAVGDRPDVCSDVRRDRLRVLHHRRVLPDDPRVAGRLAHVVRDGARRAGDGPLVARHPADQAAVPQRRRVAIHVRAVRGAARRDRCDAVDRDRRRLLRQRARRDGERLLQGRTHPRPPHARAHGARSTTSSWRPSAGSTGTTTSGCTATCATYHRPSSKGASTLPSRATRP